MATNLLDKIFFSIPCLHLKRGNDIRFLQGIYCVSIKLTPLHDICLLCAFSSPSSQFFLCHHLFARVPVRARTVVFCFDNLWHSKEILQVFTSFLLILYINSASKILSFDILYICNQPGRIVGLIGLVCFARDIFCPRRNTIIQP